MKRTIAAVLITVCVCGLPACKDAGVREARNENTLISVVCADPRLTLFRLCLKGEYERELVSVSVVERIASTERDTYLWISLWATRPGGSNGTIEFVDRVTFHTSRGDFTLTRSADDHRALGLSKPPHTVIRRGPGEGHFPVDMEEIAMIDADADICSTFGDNRYEFRGSQKRAFDAPARYLQETRC